MLERARKAEVIVLELRQVMAQRQYASLIDDASASARHFEQEAARYAHHLRHDDAKLLQAHAQVH